ncbi:MAG: tRNA lysidine(34) synthetase TilS [Oscillospiraceae bacterium]|nr:tRNA lysidine(34) synthetase TilS [Oscillospiraceae bacterium]
MEKLFALAEEYDMLPAGGRILCAVSGGPDSMCLLVALCKAGLDVTAAHYNHRLRGSESDADAEFVNDFCRAHGIPLELGSGDVSAEAARRKRGIEETGRELRYAFLRQAAERVGAVRIATAHNADDNAETFMLNFIRGAGLQGLCGIPPRRGSIVRPLLTTQRREIMAFLNTHDIPYRSDSSNDCLDYTRNQIRHRIMPLLGELNPRFLEHASDGIRRLRADHDVLNARAASVFRSALQESGEGITLPRTALTAQPPAIASRVVKLALERLGGSGSARHIGAILTLASSAEGSAQVSLPGAVTVTRSYHTLLFSHTLAQDGFSPVALREGMTEIFGTNWMVLCKKTICPSEKQKKDETFFIKCDMLNGAIMARPRRSGDSIRLPHRPSKPLKKLFSDEKIPRRLRGRIPVLADDLGVIAVAGFGPEENRLASPGDEAYELLLLKQGEDRDAPGH